MHVPSWVTFPRQLAVGSGQVTFNQHLWQPVSSLFVSGNGKPRPLSSFVIRSTSILSHLLLLSTAFVPTNYSSHPESVSLLLPLPVLPPLPFPSSSSSSSLPFPALLPSLVYSTALPSLSSVYPPLSASSLPESYLCQTVQGGAVSVTGFITL